MGKTRVRTTAVLRYIDIGAEGSEVGMMFQQFNLFPCMTLIQNMFEAPTPTPGTVERAGGVTRPEPA